MIIDCISDLHGHYPKLQGGDLLIVAGDLTATDSEFQHAQFAYWLERQEYNEKIVVCGNHDCLIENVNPFAINMFPGAKYLCDSGTEFQWNEPTLTKDGSAYAQSNYSFANKKLKIWGSPWTPLFEGVNTKCTAFMLPEAELEAKFALIPSDVDILITHGPPIGFMDEVKRYDTGKIENCGSESLYLRLYKQEIRPKLHVFGHIHERYGHIPEILDMPGVQMVNCSHVNEHYKPVNKPIRVIL